MDNEEKKILLNEIRSVGKLEFPELKLPSIPKEGLILQNDNFLLHFETGEYLNKKTNTLYINNKETFNGIIEEDKNKYFIKEGEYKWSSGQTYVGNFVKNDLNVGTLKFPEGYSFKGEFENGKFKKGEFKWNKIEYAKGEFKDGLLEGEATIDKDKCYIEGNFVKGKLENRVRKCIIRKDNHEYELSNFDIKDGKIVQERLTIKKDGENIVLILKSSSKMKDKNDKKLEELKSKQKNEIRITTDEMTKLNISFNLINEIVPRIEIPSIEKKKLKIKKEEEDTYIFENGSKAKYDDESFSYVLELPNKETFKGQLDEDDKPIIYLLEGEYEWSSGQKYIGNFNKNNQFDSDGEEVELIFKDEWKYKGTFKNGKLDHGTFTWINKGEKEYSLEAYFSEGKIKGNTNIKWGDSEIKGNFEESTIQYFETTINDHKYIIDYIDKDIEEEEDLIIEKDDENYFVVQYTIENNKVKIGLTNKLNVIETILIVDTLKKDISFPQLSISSINKGGLKPKSENIINLGNNIAYNTENKVLSLPNKETFKGELGKDKNKYWLKDGVYEWPSGQKYIGKFNSNNMFEGDSDSKIIIETKQNNFTYVGGFKNGKPYGKGEIKWDNGDEIKGTFIKGKINGKAIVKKNNITFNGDYNFSLINGDMDDIKVKINGKNYEIKKISIHKGIIENNILDIIDEENSNSENLKLRLTKEEKNIILPKENDLLEKNENFYVLLKVLRILQKLRNFSFPEYSLPTLEWEGLTKEENHEKLRLTLPNDEIIKKYKYKINDNKFCLISSEYKWPTGQKYNGNFKNNVFDSECSNLKYKDIWEYNGAFKNGEIEGKGDFNNYIKGEYISGNFEKGKIKGDIIYSDQEYDFEGKIDSMDKLYIKTLKNKIQNIEIYDFKIDNKIIKYKIYDINSSLSLTTEMKLKIIEALISNPYEKKKKFYYNEPFEKEESKENLLKILKIKDNIRSQKLNKLSIYCDKMEKYNRIIKGEIGKMYGISINQNIDSSEFLNLIKTIEFNKIDAINVTYKIKQAEQMRKESEKDEYFDELEAKEIMKVCNNKMMKDIMNEIDLICNDIITLKKEKACIEKEKNNKSIERNDLIYYYNILNEYCDELINEREEIEKKKAEIEKSILILKEININKMKFNNKKMLEKIKEQNDKIKKGNEEKEKLRQQIEELKKKLKNKNK